MAVLELVAMLACRCWDEQPEERSIGLSLALGLLW